MPNGIITYSSTGGMNFNSPSMSANFFDTAVTTSSTQSIGSAAFNTTGAIVTPMSVMSLTINYSGLPYIRANTAGVVASGGSQFYSPSAYMLAGYAGYQPYGINSSLSCSVMRFGKLAGGSSGYGFECSASDGNLAVSQSYQTFYVHPDSSGNRIRSATANSNATAIYSSTGGTISSYSQSLSQNITFDYPLDNPPLIFVTESSAPIAFNGMIRNANGKYVGASICSSPSYGVWGAALGNGYIYATSATFSYFIVSSQEPMYGEAVSPNGLEVYSPSGWRLFSSSFYVPSISRSTTPSLPYMQLSGTYNTISYTTHNMALGIKTASQGVCINSFYAITGMIGYASVDFGGGNQGPITLTGRYVDVDSTSFTITGAATSTFYMAYPALTNIPNSVDFHRNSVSTMDYFIADYQR